MLLKFTGTHEGIFRVITAACALQSAPGGPADAQPHNKEGTDAFPLVCTMLLLEIKPQQPINTVCETAAPIGGRFTAQCRGYNGKWHTRSAPRTPSHARRSHWAVPWIHSMLNVQGVVQGVGRGAERGTGRGAGRGASPWCVAVVIRAVWWLSDSGLTPLYPC